MNLSDEFDENLPPSGKRLICEARDFSVNVLQPAGASVSGWGQSNIKRACAIGLGGIEVSRDYGGAGLPFSVRARVAEELARADFAISFAVVNHHNAAARIAEDGSDQAKSEFLADMLRGDAIGCTAMSEQSAGSDFGAIQTAAIRTTSGWTINGAKRWIANAAGANILLTFAQTDIQHRSREGIACFIVQAANSGFVRSRAESMAGIEPAGIGGFELHDYHAADSDVLYLPGQGFIQGMAGVNKARTHIAAMACGMVSACLEWTLRYSQTRYAFGHPIIKHQGLRWSLSDIATALTTMRLLTYRAAHLIDNSSRDAVMAAAMAKQYAAEQCRAAIAACIDAAGAIGMSTESPLSRHYAASPAIGIADGTTAMMRERIGAVLEKSGGNI